MVALHLAMLIWVPVFSLLYYALDAPVSADIILSGGIFLVTSLVLLHQGHSPSFCGNFLTGAAWYVYTGLACCTGGVGAPVMVWYASIPILSVLMSGTRAGSYWTMLSALTIACFTLAQQFNVQCLNELTAAGTRFMQFTGLVGLLTCVYLLVFLLKKIEQEAQEALHSANRALERQATIDVLTGVGNRRSFDVVLDQEWRRHARDEAPLSVLLIDVDHFKQFNDELGHLAGDDCLRHIARAIDDCLRRPGDFVARYGGEEFAVVLPDTDSHASLVVAEMIRETVQSLRIGHPGSAVCPYVTISIGLTTVIPRRDGWYLEFVHEADMALYQAKAQGRNTSVHGNVVSHQAVPAGPTVSAECSTALDRR